MRSLFLFIAVWMVLPALHCVAVEISDDIAAVRAEAMKAGQPCIIVLNSDAPALCGFVKSAEATLFPTIEFKMFAEGKHIAAVKSFSPESARLCAEFSIATRNLWFVILNAKGETLDEFCPESEGECSAESARGFIGRTVAHLKRGLAETTTLQDLQRAWLKNVDDPAAQAALHARLDKTRASFGLLCNNVLADASVPPATKATIEMQSYLGGVKDSHYLPENERTAVALLGEDLLARQPDHALSGKLCQMLAAELKEGFDGVGRWDASLQRLQKKVEASPSPTLKARVLSMKRQRDDFVSQIQAAQKQLANDDPAQAFFAAQLGDAKTTVKILSKPEYAQMPQYADLLKAAKAKLAESGR